MIIMMIILIIGLLCEISLKKKKPPVSIIQKRQGQELNSWPLGAASARRALTGKATSRTELKPSEVQSSGCSTLYLCKLLPWAFGKN